MRYLFPALLVLLLASCGSAPKPAATATEMAAPASPAASYAGNWAVTVKDTPMGTATGTMKLTETDGKLAGVFVTADGKSLPLKSVSPTADGLMTSFYFPQYDVDVDVKLKGKPTDAVLVGRSMGQFDTTAKRL